MLTGGPVLRRSRGDDGCAAPALSVEGAAALVWAAAVACWNCAGFRGNSGATSNVLEPHNGGLPGIRWI